MLTPSTILLYDPFGHFEGAGSIRVILQTLDKRMAHKAAEGPLRRFPFCRRRSARRPLRGMIMPDAAGSGHPNAGGCPRSVPALARAPRPACSVLDRHLLDAPCNERCPDPSLSPPGRIDTGRERA
jgi:hypothetical protein